MSKLKKTSKEAIKGWFVKQYRKLFPKPIDTSPDQFNEWFAKKIGCKLRGGEVYYAVCIVGKPNVPKQSGKFEVYSDYETAKRMKKELQWQNKDVTLEIRKVRIYHSNVEVS